MNDVNFFWSGPDFYFLEFIVIHSHLKSGHKAVVWLHGEKPETQYWKDIEEYIVLKNADEIFDTTKFISEGGNLRTAADLWRFNFLYKIGGLYCDTDAFALRKFPDDEWIVCSGERFPNLLSIGVLKAPAGHPIFLECISKTNKQWGNVQIFSTIYMEYFGNSNPTHKNELFYPYNWKSYMSLFKKIRIPVNAYSIHFYSNAIEAYLRKRNHFFNHYLPLLQNIKLQNIDAKWCEKNPATLLGKLWLWLSN